MSKQPGVVSPAPTRIRRTLTNKTPLIPSTNIKNNNKKECIEDELVKDLTSLSLDSISKKNVKSTSTSTSAATSTAISKPRIPGTIPKSTSTINKPLLPPTERAREAMKVINTSLQTISTINKSGWKAITSNNSTLTNSTNSTITTTNPSSTRPTLKSKASSSSINSITSNQGSKENISKIELATESCSKALEELRYLILEKKINNKLTEMEKASGSLIANLVEMELYTLALPLLALMRFSLLSHFSDPTRLVIAPNSSILEYIPILSFPLPLDSSSVLFMVGLVPLILAVQQYTLGCLFRTDLTHGKDIAKRIELVSQILKESGNPLDWKRLFHQEVESRKIKSGAENDEMEVEGVEQKLLVDEEMVMKRLDSMMTSMFGTITKGCVGADTVASPESLIYLRSRALLFYASTRPLYLDSTKVEAFYEQTRKVLLLYGRRAEELQVGELKINEIVKGVFKEIVLVLDSKKVGREGKAWRTLCEVGLHIAKRADDLAMIDQCSNWIGLEVTAIDPETQVSQICARIVKATALIESFFKSSSSTLTVPEGSNVSNQFIVLRNSIPLLTSLRSLGEDILPVEAHNKIDKVLGRLQYSLIKRMKGSKRVDQLMTNAGEKKSKSGEIESSMIGLLNDLALHAESLALEPLISDAVESLLLLAYSNLSVDDRTTHTPTYLLLGRCLPLLSFTPTSIALSTQHYSIRSLASAYFNIGGTLFNLGKCSDSIRFTTRACEITHTAVQSWSASMEIEGDEVKKSVEDLKRYLPKRYECLAMAQHAIGDKKNAYESYVLAIINQSKETWDELALAAALSPISALLIRFSPIYKLLQRITKISTFELNRSDSQTLSLRAQIEAAETLKISESAIGAILELQILCLDSNLDKPETLVVVGETLEALLTIYSTEEFPMRRARTLVRKMQHQSSPSLLKQDKLMTITALEIQQLCTRDSLGNDEALRSYSPQYLAFSHVWLGFHSHQQQLLLASTPSVSSVFNSENTATEARIALKILRDSLDSEISSSPSAAARKVLPPTPNNKVEPLKSPKGRSVKRVTRTAAFKTPMVSRTRPGGTHTIHLVTPPSRGAIDLTTGGKSHFSPRKTDTLDLLLDDSERCYALLETMSNLLGALGFSLLRISYLKFLRRLGSKSKSFNDGAFVTSSAYLGHEYLRLGKTLRSGLVFAQAESRILNATKSGAVLSPEIQIVFYTYYAEYLSMLGNQDRSLQAYDEARKLANDMSSTSINSTSAILERTLLLQRSATAAGVFSVMLQRKGDLSASLGPAMQALRVWSRALRNISRLSLLSVEPLTEDNKAFASSRTDRNAPLPDHPGSSKRQTVHLGTPNSALTWKIAECLLSSMLRVATIYLIRGTPKSADHYAEQAVHLAEDMGSSRLLVRAMIVRVEVRLQSHNLVETRIDLDRMDELLGSSSSCPEAIDAKRLRADLLLRESSASEAHQLYVSAQKSLDLFVQAAAEGDIEVSPGKLHTPLSSSISKSPAITSPSPRQVGTANDAMLPATLAHILRMRVGLLRREDKKDESANVLRRLARLASSPEDRADELRLLATIQLEDLLSKFHSDSVLDTVLSIPVLGIVNVKSNAPMSNAPLIPTTTLKEIDTLLARAIALSVSRVEPSKLRELSVVTASLRSLQATVGKAGKRSAADVASLLDLGVAVALRREMLHAIESKLEDSTLHDDTLWPSIELTSSENINNNSTTNYWISVRERYRTESAEPIMTEPAFSALLPIGWTVASLHLTAEKDCLILVRHRKAEEPLVFKMPLDRQARRENEEETLSYATAIGELQDIISRSNAGTQRAKHVDGKLERASWWKERIELDNRLKMLTESMEETWLGAFKSLLIAPRTVSAETLATFGAQVEAVLRRSIVRSQTTKAARFKFDNGILASLSALPPDARDEDIEDLFYYMTESLQLPSDETDVDQVVCDLRTALEELHANSNSETALPADHTFLILDKSLQSFPWESIPCLRGRSISRLPALSFLRDRIDLAAVLTDPTKPSTCEIIVNPAKTSFVLNPSGDLKNTQAVFEPWLRSKKADGWSGIIGRAPSDEEMKVSLSTRDLFLYFGHGGAEQYVRSQTIRNLSRCAVTMLWGCSSGMLKDVGDHDPTGTPYHYLIAGCPALVANLWDVTDKDIDKFAETVFEKLGLKGDDTLSSGGTLASAVGGSRDICNLRYLNGAAPVVYGCPVRFLKA